VAIVVANALRLWLVWRFVHIQPFDRHYSRLALPAGAAGGAMLAIHLALRDGSWPADLVGTAAAGLIAYVGSMLAFGLAPAERRAIRTILGRAGASGDP
jgi:hypothetical protein